MSSARKALRAELIDALETITLACEPLADVPVISAWSRDLSPDALPVIGVAIPTEERTAAAQDTDETTLTVVVVVKRAAAGDDSTDTEDALDDDAESLIGPLEDAMQGPSRDFALRSSAIDISGEGSPRIGTLTLTFGATILRARNLP
jgi:hypothetical protein